MFCYCPVIAFVIYIGVRCHSYQFNMVIHLSTQIIDMLLLSPYLYFISFLYLDLYATGDDARKVKGLSCKPNIYVS